MGTMAASPAPDISSHGALREDLHWLFARLKQGLAIAEIAAVSKHGMTLWGYTVLMAVVDAPARNQLALAQSVSVDKSKLVIIIDELENAGLVVRKPDPADRRARIVEVTPKGSRVLKAAREDVAAIEHQLLATLDEPARDTLRTALGHLVDEPIMRVEYGMPPPPGCPTA